MHRNCYPNDIFKVNKNSRFVQYETLGMTLRKFP